MGNVHVVNAAPGITGLRNLIQRPNYVWGSDAVSKDTTTREAKMITVLADTQLSLWGTYTGNLSVPLADLSIVGACYTAGLDVKVTDPTASSSITFAFDMRRDNTLCRGTCSVPVDGQWHRLAVTVQIGQPGCNWGVFAFVGHAAAGTVIEIDHESLVRGRTDTDWTPAPEDYERRLAAIEAKLGIAADEIWPDGPEIMADPAGGG